MSESRLLQVNVDVSQVVDALEQMQRRAMRMRPFMGAVGMIMLKASDENFEQQGRPKWKGWAPLTRKIYESNAFESAADEANRTRKTEKGRINHTQRLYSRNMERLASRGILNNDGTLKKSVQLGDVTEQSVEVGSALVYARIHQLGGVIKPKKAKALAIPVGAGKVIKLQSVKIPARPFLQLQETDYQTIIRIAEDYLLRGDIG